MKNLPVATTAGLFAIALSLGLVGCDSSSDTAATTTTSTTSETSTTASPSPLPGNDDDTINDYVTESDIAETPIKPGEPGTPTFDFPIPRMARRRRRDAGMGLRRHRLRQPDRSE